MKTSVKRFFSLVCAICMMISNVPVTVIAEMITAEESSAWSEPTSDDFDALVSEASGQTEETEGNLPDTANVPTYVDMQVGKSAEVSLDDIVRLAVHNSGLIYVVLDSNIELTSHRDGHIEQFLATNGKLEAELSVVPGVYELTFASMTGRQGLITVDILNEEQYLAKHSHVAPEKDEDAEKTDVKSDEETASVSDDETQESVTTEAVVTEPVEDTEVVAPESVDAEDTVVGEAEASEEPAQEVESEGETVPVREGDEEMETPAASEAEEGTEVPVDTAEVTETIVTEPEMNPEVEDTQVVSDAENSNVVINVVDNEAAPVVEDTQDESTQSGKATEQVTEKSEMASEEVAPTGEPADLINETPEDENESSSMQGIIIVLSPEGTDEAGEELSVTTDTSDEAIEENEIDTNAEETASTENTIDENDSEDTSDALAEDESASDEEQKQQTTEVEINPTDSISANDNDETDAVTTTFEEPAEADEQANETVTENENDTESVFDKIGGVEGTTDTETDESEESMDPLMIKIAGESIDNGREPGREGH